MMWPNNNHFRCAKCDYAYTAPKEYPQLARPCPRCGSMKVTNVQITVEK